MPGHIVCTVCGKRKSIKNIRTMKKDSLILAHINASSDLVIDHGFRVCTSCFASATKGCKDQKELKQNKSVGNNTSVDMSIGSEEDPICPDIETFRCTLSEMAANNSVIAFDDSEMAGANDEMVGDIGDMAGDNDEMVGDIGDMAGDNDEMVGDNGEMADDNVEMVGDNGEMAESDSEMVKNNSEICDDDSFVTIPFGRAKITNKSCIVCNAKNNITVIPTEAKINVLVTRGLIIKGNARCCQKHLNGRVMKNDAIQKIPQQAARTTMNSTETFELINNMRTLAMKRSLDFDTPGAISDADYYQLTGLNEGQFNNLAQYVTGYIRNSARRSVRLSLALLLMKLRTGMSHSLLATIFGIKRQTVSRAIHSARCAVMREFVPKYLGIQHISREDFIAMHTRNLAKKLFANGEDVAILVADGTYIYIEKSSNYSFQRRTYSMHKGRPLLKPMMIVSSTGYILDVFGPYFADGKNNDANILNSLMKANSSALLDWLHPEDIMVVDRGFRDSIELLEELGLIPKMPHFLSKGAQHSCTDANESRLVTKIRWVVEGVNGLLKTWKALGAVFPNSQVPYVGEYVRIVSALCNAYRPPRITAAHPDDEIMADRMLTLNLQPNNLQQIVLKEGWIKKKIIWEPMEATSLEDFPRLTLDDLTRLTLGVYQLKQAKSYTEEHLGKDGLYALSIYKESANIVRIRLQSRHTSAKQYYLWIRYEAGFEPIREWYCQCKTGARTIGCCAHVASVLWYLGYYRYSDQRHRSCSAFQDYVVDAVSWSDSDSASDVEQNDEN